MVPLDPSRLRSPIALTVPSSAASSPTATPTTPTLTHDAHRLLVNLRDHLARHDKPIAFLLGAGASSAVRVPQADDPASTRSLIPAVDDLTSQCESEVFALGEKYKISWTQIREQCLASDQTPNIENILSRLQMMLGALGSSDTLTGLTLAELRCLDSCVRRTIATLVTPEEATIPDQLPHSHLARWLASAERRHPVELFTVNYDILIELALERENVPIFDGFVGSYQPFFYADSLRRPELAPGVNWTRLWKMHGSVTWCRRVQRGRSRIVRGSPDSSGTMIFPSFLKYDESRQQPYSAFMDRFTNFLSLDDALLVVAGFGFGDEHINALIFGALENRPRTHVYALQYVEDADDAELIQHSQRRHNIVVVGPETGVIAGQRAPWACSDDALLVDMPFELATSRSGPPSTPGTAASPRLGQMKIGDFAHLCEFLASIASRG